MTTASTGSAAGFNPERFAGGLYDRTTGDLHYGQRWYDPTIGRFTQQDSVSHIEDLSQENRYAYAGDDPINNIDPTGKSLYGFLGFVAGGVAATGICVLTGAETAGIGCQVGISIATGAGTTAGETVGGATPQDATDDGLYATAGALILLALL